MADSKGGTLKITESYLQDFVKNHLQEFIRNFENDPGYGALADYAGGTTKLLVGNVGDGVVPSATDLQAGFKNFATQLHNTFEGFKTALNNLSTDLQTVEAVLENESDKNNITAQEMALDLSNISFSGGSGSLPPPSTSGST